MILNRSTQICGYADYILVIARTLPALEALCAELSKEASSMGLEINPNKTKYMRFSASPARRSVNAATINGVTYEGVAEFIYLGTLICNDNRIEKEIQRRILQSVFFWEFPRRLKFKSRRFGTQCRFHHPERSPRTMEPTLSSETSAFKLRTPGKFPKEHRLQDKFYTFYCRILITNTVEFNCLCI